MAKALDKQLRQRIGISDGDERRQLVHACAELVMRVPQAAPGYSQQQSMAKAFVATTELRIELDQTEFEADWDRAEREYRPRPTREFAEMERDLAVMNSLVRARQRLAKCVSEGDHLGAINAMEVQLTAERALAKSEDSRHNIQQLRTQLYATATESGFVYGDRGLYRMAKASVAATNTAKQFDKMYATLTELLDRVTGANMRQQVESLRTEVDSQAQAMGCRLRNGQFVPFAS